MCDKASVREERLRFKLDVLFIITSLGHGGAEGQVVEIANCLSKRGWNVGIISIKRPQAYLEKLRGAGVKLFYLDVWHELMAPIALLRAFNLIRKWRPKILHSHMVHANILARLVRLFVLAPVLICTAHSIDERGRRDSGKLRVYLYRFTDPLCNLTTQTSRAGVKRYVQIKAVPKDKILYIPNGVDTGRFRPDLEVRQRMRKILALDHKFIWLSIGRFEPPKDYETMLWAFTKVSRMYPHAHLLIAGDGSLRSKIQTLAHELGITQNVSFLGIRTDVPDLMNAADAFVMASLWEGMPVVLLEAHSVGLPVVATDVGGINEVVLHRKTGYLVPPRNHEALAQAMFQMMNLPNGEIQKMKMLARQHVEINFSLDRIVDIWESIYRNLMEQKRLL